MAIFPVLNTSFEPILHPLVRVSHSPIQILPLFPLVTISLFSVSMSLLLSLLYSLVCCFLDSTYKWCHMIFVFGLLSMMMLSPSMLLQITLFHSFYCWVWCVFVSLCVYNIFFIHSSVDGHLDCFHTLAIVNNSAMNYSPKISCIFLQ